ncbi:MAG: phaJ [Alphaproteobacteria bacterium]|jgi:acyl dehydratase|nr:phaJ [Alphaproteobacteria bacterium]
MAANAEPMAKLEQGTSQLYAEDFAVGQRYAGQSVVLGDPQFRQFAELTGDRHPIHYDDAYAAKSRFGKRLAHGLLVTSITALGATPLSDRLQESMVAFLEQGMKFRAPALVGDRVSTGFVVESVALKSEKKSGVVTFSIAVVNDKGEVLAEGFHRYLLRMSG